MPQQMDVPGPACRLCGGSAGHGEGEGTDTRATHIGDGKVNGLTEKIIYCLNIDVLSDPSEFPTKVCNSCLKNVNKFHKYKLLCEQTDRLLKEALSRDSNKIKLENDSSYTRVKTEPSEDFFGDFSDGSLDDEPLLNLKNLKNETDIEENTCREIIRKRIKKTSSLKISRKRKISNRPLKSGIPKRKSPSYCNICHVEFGVQFTEHMKASHGVEEAGFKCFGCEKLFRTRKSRLAHEINFCKGLKDGYKCAQCCRFLPSRGAYETHIRAHRAGRGDLPDELFKCSHCDKLFKRRTYLQVHVQTVHKETKNYVCEICGRVFTRQDYLRKHILTHTGQKHYVCPHCGFRSTQKSSLTIHIRKHTGERPFSCDICQQKCISSSNLLAHRRRHEGVKKFECTLCNKKFGYKLSLEEHMASTHERLKTHCCKVCGATYTRQRGLRRHVRVKHGVEYSKLIGLEDDASTKNLSMGVRDNLEIEHQNLNMKQHNLRTEQCDSETKQRNSEIEQRNIRIEHNLMIDQASLVLEQNMGGQNNMSAEEQRQFQNGAILKSLGEQNQNLSKELQKNMDGRQNEAYLKSVGPSNSVYVL